MKDKRRGNENDLANLTERGKKADHPSRFRIKIRLVTNGVKKFCLYKFSETFLQP